MEKSTFDDTPRSHDLRAEALARSAPDDFYEAYTKKHRVNLARQNSGYHTKDEHDSKHI